MLSGDLLWSVWFTGLPTDRQSHKGAAFHDNLGIPVPTVNVRTKEKLKDGT